MKTQYSYFPVADFNSSGMKENPLAAFVKKKTVLRRDIAKDVLF